MRVANHANLSSDTVADIAAEVSGQENLRDVMSWALSSPSGAFIPSVVAEVGEDKLLVRSERNKHQRKIIRTMKGLETNHAGTVIDKEIPVIGDKNLLVGLLKPLDYHLANNEEVVDSLSAWRRRFKRFFFSQFDVTSERTRSWLNDAVIKDDTRILFLITDTTNKLIGHVGACHISGEAAELDNFIRGERGGDPRVMLLSGLSLIGWMYRVLNIRKIYARVLADNYRTLSVYEAAGCFERSSLHEIVTGCNDQSPLKGHKFVLMTLDMQKFLSRYPWMSNPR